MNITHEKLPVNLFNKHSRLTVPEICLNIKLNFIFDLIRCNVVGQDLNRAWAETNKFLHSEVLEVHISRIESLKPLFISSMKYCAQLKKVSFTLISKLLVLNYLFQIKKQLVYYDNHSESHSFKTRWNF